jgi:hypothetical protein
VQENPALTTEQPKQDGDPVTPCHADIDRELVAERTVQDTHLIACTYFVWQFDRTFALARSDFRNHNVGDLSRYRPSITKPQVPGAQRACHHPVTTRRKV